MLHSNVTPSHENPFVPGIGDLPPFQGRRPSVDRVLDETIKMLTKTDEPWGRCLYMYGPRGTGKTVQLKALRRQIHQRPEADILIRLFESTSVAASRQNSGFLISGETGAMNM